MTDLDSIRRRALAASDGEWSRHGADVWLDSSSEALFHGRDGSADTRAQADRDAEFVAHARSDVLSLLILIDSARAAPADPALASNGADNPKRPGDSGPPAAGPEGDAVVAVVGPDGGLRVP